MPLESEEATAIKAVRILSRRRGLRPVVQRPRSFYWTNWHVSFLRGHETQAIDALKKRMRELRPRQYGVLPAMVAGSAKTVIVKSKKAAVRLVAQYSIQDGEVHYRMDVLVRA